MNEKLMCEKTGYIGGFTLTRIQYLLTTPRDGLIFGIILALISRNSNE